MERIAAWWLNALLSNLTGKGRRDGYHGWMRTQDVFFFENFFEILLGGSAAQTPRILAGGALPPQTIPLVG